MYKILFIDLDQTLVDFDYSEAKSLQLIHEHFYAAVAYEEFEAKFKAINAALWKQVGAAINPLTPEELGTRRFEELNEVLALSHDHVSIARTYEVLLGESTKWLPGAKAAVEFLAQRGHIMAIVTNGIITTQKLKYERHQLERWFSCNVISGEVGVSKPDPRIFIEAKKLLQEKHADHDIDQLSMLMVGDSLSSDGHGAMNFGIHFCHVSPKEVANHHNIPIHHTVKSIADLPNVLGYQEEYQEFLTAKIAASSGVLHTPRF